MMRLVLVLVLCASPCVRADPVRLDRMPMAATYKSPSGGLYGG